MRTSRINHHELRWRTGLLAAVAIALTASHVLAANSITISLPAGGKPVAGLMLEVDATWVDNDGYRPVRVTARCAQPATADRTLTIELKTPDAFIRGSDTVTQNLEIAAGASAGSITVPMPQFSQWGYLSIEVFEDGRKIDALSSTSGTGSSGPNAVPTAWLHVTETPANSNMEIVFGGPQPAGNQVDFHEMYLQCSIAEMPEEWVNLTSIDMVTLSVDELELMAKTKPRAWQAVRAWTAAGGNLCIYGADEHLERVARIDELLADGSHSVGDAGQASSGWSNPNRTLIEPVPGEVLEADAAVDVASVQQADPTNLPTGEIAAQLLALDPPPFRWREFCLGRVVALATDHPLPMATDPTVKEKVALWQWVLGSIGWGRSVWSQRHGISYFDDPNSDFWNLTIPGVGLPPVDAYRILITLFVVLIGPVNYFLLKRLRRLYLLLFIVPATAAVATTLLVGYALIADGLDVRLRARSYTLLDQTRGEAVTWSRLSYYAGLAPYGGLTFPRDVAVFPYRFENPQYGSNSEYRTTSRDDEQHLARGWLLSRTPTQYIALRSGSESQRLVIEPNDGQLKVANRLGATVSQAIVCDADGKLFYLKQLPPGQSAIVEPLLCAADGAPLLPAELYATLTGQQRDDTFYSQLARSSSPLLGMHRNNYNWYFHRNPAMAGVNQTSSLLEQSLAACAVRFAPGSATAMPKQTYLAIVDRCDPQLMGAADAVEAGSLHVIEGKW